VQWLWDSSQINGDNLKNVSREAIRHFRNRKREYLKDKSSKLENNIKNKNIRDLYRGIHEFKKDYHPRCNSVKDENGNLLKDSHNILNRWMNCFFQLLNAHRVSNVKQIEIHTAEPLVPDPSHFEVEFAIAKLKEYKSSGSDQISENLIQAGREILQSEIHKLINSVRNKEELPDQLKESIIVPVHKKGEN
jgi:hypothetical protein